MTQASEDAEDHQHQLEPVIFLVWDDLNRAPVKKTLPTASVRMIPSVKKDDGIAR